MLLNQQPGPRAKLLQFSWLLIALTAFDVIITSSAASVGNTDKKPDRFKQHIDKCDKQFKRFSNTTLKIQRRNRHGVPVPIATASATDNMLVELDVFGKVVQLDLTWNNLLIHPKYVEKSITESGKVEYFQDAKSTDSSCYFIGTVLGQASSAAAAATCDGFRAQIASNGELYHIESVDGTPQGLHRVYRQSDTLLPKIKCGYDSGMPDIAHIMEEIQKTGRQKRAAATINWPNDLPGTAKIVELYVVNDYSQFLSQGSNLTKTVARTKEIYNFASSLYQPLRMYISIVGVEVWTNGSLIPVSQSNALTTLGNFTQYRVNKINKNSTNDIAQLLTTYIYQGSLAGLSWMNTMCSASTSAGIVSDISAASGFTATVASHEMGHNLNMLHDDQLAPVNCACNDPTGQCIMSSILNLPAASRWSNCSTSALSTFLSTPASSCLNDFNGVLFDPTAVCGNGIVESGEECDCGSAPLTDCNAACCNPTTCKLIAPAACATGICCNIATCQPKPVGTVCRAASSPCDLAEYCGGVNGACPSDYYKRDGANCTVNGEQAYCINAACQTRSTQCKTWWGPSTVDSASNCYTAYNPMGKVYGNCGTINQTAGLYVACSASDALCGSIKCNVNSGVPPTLQTSYSSYYALLSGNNCRMPVALTTPSLHMTPNGASCGAYNMCLNQHCVSVSSVYNQTLCGCSQHGVCNNLNECHCDAGYAPPYCSQPGSGGSLHSNQITP